MAGHPVGDFHHLVELVGDDDDGVSVLLHPPQHGEQLVDLLDGEHRGGLVQDDDLGSVVQHLDDLQGLLLRNGHIGHLFPWIDVKAEPLGHLPDLVITAPVQGKARLLPAHPDVVGGGEHIHQLEVLVDHADPQGLGLLGRPDGDRHSVHQDLSAVRLVDAGQHIHQCCLARAVFSKQSQDLPLSQGEIYIFIGHHTAEGLGDAPHFNGVFRRHGTTLPLWSSF